MDINNPFDRYREIIPHFSLFTEHLSSPLPAYIRLNTLKAPERVIIQRLEGQGARLQATPVEYLYRVVQEELLRSGPAYHLGFTYPQALSSTLPVLALDIKPELLVLDMCAAPGGKTTHMAQLMLDSGIIVANDRKYGRITALMANLKRLGITNTVVTNCRGGFLAPGTTFHRVLVDAPCSGEGKYRIRSDGELTHRRQGNTDLPAIQKGLILRAYDLTRPGGLLVYSTCTINPDENEAVVNHLLKKRDAVVVEWEPPLKSHPGLVKWQGKEFDKNLKACRRFYPHEIDSVGFFVAKILKPGKTG